MAQQHLVGFQQLLLPLGGLTGDLNSEVAIPRANRVFVNRNLRMATIDWVGFDMDYTLATYRQPEMDQLSVELTLRGLTKLGYPDRLRRLQFDTRFPIRGLLVDRRYGHVLKMDRHKVVYKGYHGFERLDRSLLVDLYQRPRIRPHTSRYHWIDTLFALSEVTSFCAIVNALEKHHGPLDYGRLFSDIRSSVDTAHREGRVYAEVLSDLPRFVAKDPALARTLHKLRSAGKRLFLLTNSPWHYTDAMMTYLLGGALPEYPTWQHYFEVVVASAQKPDWFRSDAPLRERRGHELVEVSTPLERGRSYEGGNLLDFEQRLGIAGPDVLYVGDHIYGDILRSKKESSWRTALIIQELDNEVAAHETCLVDVARLRELEERRRQLEDELRFYQLQYKRLARAVRQGKSSRDDAQRSKMAIERVRREMRLSDAEEIQLSERVDRRFHPYWGSLLKEQHELSSFGLQVEHYADLYTRSVSCLEAYSPTQFFRSPYDLMPHEL